MWPFILAVESKLIASIQQKYWKAMSLATLLLRKSKWIVAAEDVTAKKVKRPSASRIAINNHSAISNVSSSFSTQSNQKWVKKHSFLHRTITSPLFQFLIQFRAFFFVFSFFVIFHHSYFAGSFFSFVSRNQDLWLRWHLLMKCIHRREKRLPKILKKQNHFFCCTFQWNQKEEIIKRQMFVDGGVPTTTTTPRKKHSTHSQREGGRGKITQSISFIQFVWNACRINSAVTTQFRCFVIICHITPETNLVLKRPDTYRYIDCGVLRPANVNAAIRKLYHFRFFKWFILCCNYYHNSQGIGKKRTVFQHVKLPARWFASVLPVCLFIRI